MSNSASNIKCSTCGEEGHRCTSKKCRLYDQNRSNSADKSKCSTCGDNWNLKLLNNKSGFFTEYAKSTASEDMAEVFSHLMFYRNKVYSNDPIIEKKILFIKKNVLKIDNTFKF